MIISFYILSIITSNTNCNIYSAWYKIILIVVCCYVAKDLTVALKMITNNIFERNTIPDKNINIFYREFDELIDLVTIVISTSSLKSFQKWVAICTLLEHSLEFVWLDQTFAESPGWYKMVLFLLHNVITFNGTSNRDDVVFVQLISSINIFNVFHIII